MRRGASAFIALCLVSSLNLIIATPGCIKRTYSDVEQSMVCVCNSTYCDEIEPLGTIPAGQAVIYQSTIDGKRMDRSTVSISSTPTGKLFTFDALTLFQGVIGFGAAFTDSGGINTLDLPKPAQDLLMKQYFGPTGTEYTLCRVPMASTDFSLKPYSYADTPNDFNLTSFALQQEDYTYKLPFIKQAVELQKNSGGLKLFASPWSAPAWMKSNNAMQGGGRLRGFEGGPYWVTWGNYFVKFFEAYNKEGIDFWAATVQNEPSSGSDPGYKWQTMYFSAQMERDFIKGQLSPALKSSPISKDISIIILDDDRFNLPAFPDVVLEDEEVASLVAGIAVHWYTDVIFPASALSTTNEKHPDKFILYTESCEGWLGIGEGVSMGDFSRAEAYAHSIIEVMNNFVAGWVDWNMALDPKGGPTWAGNIVDAPIIVNKETGEFLKQPMYYALAHFTKFLKPGSARAALTMPSGLPDQVEALAALMVDGRRFLAVLNRDSTQGTSISVADTQHPGEYINLDIPARSITTVVWNE